MDSKREQPLRVLFFTSQFPHPQNPAAGIFNYQLVRELAKLCEVTVVCPLPWFPRWPFLKRFRDWYAYAEVPRRYEFRGVQVYSPKYPMLPRISGPLQALFVLLGSFGLLRRLHREHRFDLINSLWLYPDAVAAGWMGRLLGIPMVPAALGCDVNQMMYEGGKRGQILAMLRRSRSILAVSDDLRQNMVAGGIPAQRIATVPNGVDGSMFYVRDRAQSRAALGLPMDRKIIAYVGRLSEEKGLPTLIEAAGLLQRKRSDFLLCLVGDGPLMDSLRARARELGLADVVRFAGRQDHTAVGTWFGACDVFCLPSLREGCPNVVLEALSSGRPVVASKVGGIPDLVSESSGILVPARDVDGFATAFGLALDRAWDEQAIAGSMTRFTWSAAAENYHSAYLSSVGSAAGR